MEEDKHFKQTKYVLLKLCSKYFTNVGFYFYFYSTCEGQHCLLRHWFVTGRAAYIYIFFTDIYHQTTIIKFQCQLRRGEYVNYITNGGVHTGQSNSVARSHILNLSMSESIFITVLYY